MLLLCSLSFFWPVHFCQGIMMIMMMNAWLSDLLDRLLPIAAVSPPCTPFLSHCGNRGLSTWQRQPPQLKRCGNSEEFTRPVPDSGNCLYLLCGLCRRDACKSLDAHYGNPSVKKLRSPIRRCHLSAVRHPGELQIWHSFICQSDEVDETTQLTIYFLTHSSSRTEVARSRLSAPLP